MFFEKKSALFEITPVHFSTMHLPPPIVRPQAATEPPALVRFVTREDVLWNRPVFKAPPLVVRPPVIDASVFVSPSAPAGTVAS